MNMQDVKGTIDILSELRDEACKLYTSIDAYSAPYDAIHLRVLDEKLFSLQSAILAELKFICFKQKVKDEESLCIMTEVIKDFVVHNVVQRINELLKESDAKEFDNDIIIKFLEKAKTVLMNIRTSRVDYYQLQTHVSCKPIMYTDEVPDELSLLTKTDQ